MLESRFRFHPLLLGLLALWTVLVLWSVPAISQQPPAAGQPPAGQPPAGSAPSPGTEEDVAPPGQGALPESFDDPYSAYGAGAYEKALQGFVDEQIEYPEDPDVALNLGSTHYQMSNFEEADSAFQQAALSGDDAIRNQAFYNLGNSAFRQGKLQDAVDSYKIALELDPDDEDAKYNLEFVRDEIRRRHEEAQKRQEEGQQQQQQGDQGEQQQGDQQQGDQGQQQQADQQQQSGQQPQDSDGDGLSDEQERSAQNPTDPQNPDTDGDGLLDGQEDHNKSGTVDESETDPNKPDTDGDGVGDAQEAMQEQQGEQRAEGGDEPQDQEGLTPEEAERYLQSLEEGVPDQRRKLPKGARRARPEKDW